MRQESALKPPSASHLAHQHLPSPKKEMCQQGCDRIVRQSAVYDSQSCLFSILRRWLVWMGYFDPGSGRDSGLGEPEGKQDMSRPQLWVLFSAYFCARALNCLVWMDLTESTSKHESMLNIFQHTLHVRVSDAGQYVRKIMLERDVNTDFILRLSGFKGKLGCSVCMFLWIDWALFYRLEECVTGYWPGAIHRLWLSYTNPRWGDGCVKPYR